MAPSSLDSPQKDENSLIRNSNETKRSGGKPYKGE